MEPEFKGPIDLTNVNSKYRLLFECALDKVFLIDLAGNIRDVNTAVVTAYGFTREELLSMNIKALRAPGERDLVDAQLKEAFENGAIYESVHRRKDGETFPVEVSSRGIVLGSDRLLIAIVRDITKRKEAESRMAHAASFPELDPNPVLEVDNMGAITYSNRAADRLFPDLPYRGSGHPMLKGLIPFTNIPELGENAVYARDIQAGDVFFHQTIQYMPEKETIRIYSVDITGRKRAELALLDSEQKCWAIFNWTFEFIGLLAGDGTIVEMNSTALHLLSDSEAEVLGKPFWAMSWWSHSPELQAKWRWEIRQAAEGEFVRFEANLLAADRHPRYFDFSIKPLIDSAGRVDRLIVEGRDITERIRAEKELKKSRFILAKSQEMAHMGNWAWNVRTGELNMSDEGFRIFGYAPQSFRPSLAWLVSRVHPTDQGMVSDKLNSIPGEGWLGSIDYHIILPDGRVRFLNMLADKVVRDGEGNLRWVYGINQDITERKQVEEALSQSRRQLADIIDHLPDATLVVDSQRKIIVWNRAMEDMTGVKATEVLGKSNYEYAVPVYGERRPLLIDLIFEPDEVIRGWHYTNIRRAGHELMAETSFSRPLQKTVVTWVKATPFFDPGGRQIGAIESIRDVTDLRKAEAVLRESEEKFRVLAETSPAAIFLYQGDRYVYVNPSAVRITGYSKEELLSMKFRDIIHPDFRTAVPERGFARQQDMSGPSQYEFKLLRKNGEVGWALLSAGHLEYRGQPAGIGTIFDITQRKKAEEDLEEAKNSSELYVDLMSHDIGNLNQAIMGYLELAMDLLDLKGAEKDLIAKPVELVQNSSRLIEDVKKIQRVRTGEIPLETVDLGEVLRQVVARYASVPDREVSISCPPVPGHLVTGNKYLADALSEIVENSIRHSNGPIAISIDVTAVREGPKSFFKVTVDDTGPGISDEQKKYLFADLAREKIKARRIGLGLQLVKAVVEGVGGRAWAQDRVQGDHRQGSRFIVLLPAAE